MGVENTLAAQEWLDFGIVRKANSIIQTQVVLGGNNDTVWAGRVFAALLTQIQRGDKAGKTYTCDTTAWTGKISTDKNRFRLIRAEADVLIKSFFRIEDTVNQKGINIAFFNEVEYKAGGIITAQFNPKIHRFLCNFKGGCFTQYPFAEYVQLSSGYSQRIYEILCSWKAQRKVTLPIYELHYQLATPENYHKNFAQFQRKVLEPAFREITKRTTLKFEWNTVKATGSKKVAAIEIIFGERKEPRQIITAKQQRVTKRGIAGVKNALAATECFNTKNKKCDDETNSPRICAVCHNRPDLLFDVDKQTIDVDKQTANA